MDLRAEPVVLSSRQWTSKRYYSVMLCDGNTYNYGYIGTRATGSEAGDYMVVGPKWQGATPPGIKKVFRSSTDLSVRVIALSFSAPTTSTMSEGPSWLQGPDAFRLSKSAATAASSGHRLSENRQGVGEEKLLRVSRLRATVWTSARE